MQSRKFGRARWVPSVVVWSLLVGCSSSQATDSGEPLPTTPQTQASVTPSAPLGPPGPGTAPSLPTAPTDTSAMGTTQPSGTAPTMTAPAVTPTAPTDGMPTTPTTVPTGTDMGPPAPPGMTAVPGDEENPEKPLPSLLGDVTFSVPSGTFETEFPVTLSAPEGAQIHYTTDGSVPTADSPLYDGNPLQIVATTQLRAVPFSAGAAGFGSTALYVQRTFDTPSDIPIMIIEGYGGGRPQKTTPGFGGQMNEEQDTAAIAEQNNQFYDAAFMLFEPSGGMASIANAPTLVTRAGYRERGQSSAGAEKSPYRVEFWNNLNEDADYPVLGMPADADWAMIGEFYDKTQIRNSLVYHWGAEMGLQTMERRFAELYINFDGGPLEESDYFGVYAITETIKNQDDRVDINNLEPDEVTEPEITGGYIMKFDQAALDDNEPVIECTGSGLIMRTGGGFGGGQMAQMDAGAGPGHCFQYLGITDPPVVNEQQLQWITQYVQAFHDALHSSPIGDYGKYIDVPSFIDHLLIGEITKNVDAFVRSQYFNKDKEGLIKAGPLWDYNFSLGSVGADVEGWHAEAQLTGRGNDDWFLKLEQDPAFIAKTAIRWRELREGVLSDSTVDQTITDLSMPLVNAGPRDLERWPAGSGTFGGGFGGSNPDMDEAEPTTYADHIQTLRDYVKGRMAWLDEAFSAF